MQTKYPLTRCESQVGMIVLALFLTSWPGGGSQAQTSGKAKSSFYVATTTLVCGALRATVQAHCSNEETCGPQTLSLKIGNQPPTSEVVGLKAKGALAGRIYVLECHSIAGGPFLNIGLSQPSSEEDYCEQNISELTENPPAGLDTSSCGIGQWGLLIDQTGKRRSPDTKDAASFRAAAKAIGVSSRTMKQQKAVDQRAPSGIFEVVRSSVEDCFVTHYRDPLRFSESFDLTSHIVAGGIIASPKIVSWFPKAPKNTTEASSLTPELTQCLVTHLVGKRVTGIEHVTTLMGGRWDAKAKRLLIAYDLIDWAGQDPPCAASSACAQERAHAELGMDNQPKYKLWHSTAAQIGFSASHSRFDPTDRLDWGSCVADEAQGKSYAAELLIDVDEKGRIVETACSQTSTSRCPPTLLPCLAKSFASQRLPGGARRSYAADVHVAGKRTIRTASERPFGEAARCRVIAKGNTKTCGTLEREVATAKAEEKKAANEKAEAADPMPQRSTLGCLTSRAALKTQRDPAINVANPSLASLAGTWIAPCILEKYYQTLEETILTFAGQKLVMELTYGAHKGAHFSQRWAFDVELMKEGSATVLALREKSAMFVALTDVFAAWATRAKACGALPVKRGLGIPTALCPFINFGKPDPVDPRAHYRKVVIKQGQLLFGGNELELATAAKLKFDDSCESACDIYNRRP